MVLSFCLQVDGPITRGLLSVCGGRGGGLISGSLCYSRTSTPMLSAGHGFNVECTPNMDSNEIV